MQDEDRLRPAGRTFTDPSFIGILCIYNGKKLLIKRVFINGVILLVGFRVTIVFQIYISSKK